MRDVPVVTEYRLPVVRARSNSLPVVRARDNSLPVVRARDNSLPVVRARDNSFENDLKTANVARG